jgi:hypothetical protein
MMAGLDASYQARPLQSVRPVSGTFRVLAPMHALLASFRPLITAAGRGFLSTPSRNVLFSAK